MFTFLKAFRDFAMKGNVLDLAVGIIIGAAFSGLVQSAVNDVIMPPVGKLIGNVDFSNLYISMSENIDKANAEKTKAIAATQPSESGITSMVPGALSSRGRLSLAEARATGPVIAYGAFITVLINFVIVAFVVFLLVNAVNKLKKRMEAEALNSNAPTPPELPADVKLLAEIRDLLKQSRNTPREL
jgi:large conductance mechanosensitive channel